MVASSSLSAPIFGSLLAASFFPAPLSATAGTARRRGMVSTSSRSFVVTLITDRAWPACSSHSASPGTHIQSRCFLLSSVPAVHPLVVLLISTTAHLVVRLETTKLLRMKKQYARPRGHSGKASGTPRPFGWRPFRPVAAARPDADVLPMSPNSAPRWARRSAAEQLRLIFVNIFGLWWRFLLHHLPGASGSVRVGTQCHDMLFMAPSMDCRDAAPLRSFGTTLSRGSLVRRQRSLILILLMSLSFFGWSGHSSCSSVAESSRAPSTVLAGRPGVGGRGSGVVAASADPCSHHRLGTLYASDSASVRLHPRHDTSKSRVDVPVQRHSHRRSLPSHKPDLWRVATHTSSCWGPVVPRPASSPSA